MMASIRGPKNLAPKRPKMEVVRSSAGFCSIATDHTCTLEQGLLIIQQPLFMMVQCTVHCVIRALSCDLCAVFCVLCTVHSHLLLANHVALIHVQYDLQIAKVDRNEQGHPQLHRPLYSQPAACRLASA